MLHKCSALVLHLCNTSFGVVPFTLEQWDFVYRLFIYNVAHIKEDNKIDPKSEILSTNG